MSGGKLVTCATKDDVDGAIAELEDKLAVTGAVDYTVGSDGTYYVYTVDGLLAWAAACESDMSTNCVLMNNIDMEGASWTPVGTEENPYVGEFDGTNRELRNLYLHVETSESAMQYIGLFGYVGLDGTIRNLKIAECDIYLSYTGDSATGARVGAVTGYLCGKIIKCDVSGSIVVEADISTMTCAGAFAGIVISQYKAISCCTSSASVSVSNTSTGRVVAGGIAGRSESGGAIIENCFNYGDVTASTAGTSTADIDRCEVAGIVGYLHTTNGGVFGCGNSGNISGSTSSGGNVYVGGIAGSSGGAVSSCYNAGNITASGSTNSTSWRVRAGGIVGGQWGRIISCCSNAVSATITGISGALVGGIVGSAWIASIISCCSNCGTAQTGSYVGGIAGACGYSGASSQYLANTGTPSTNIASSTVY